MSSEPESTPEAEPPASLRLDEEGLPILDEVVENPPADALAERIKAELLAELEPRLQTIVRSVFTASVKVVALDLKRSFESQLDAALRDRLEQLVDEAIAKAEQTLR